MCGCECCISTKSMHSSLISWRDCYLKKIKKSETVVSMRTSIPKIADFLDIFGGKKNIGNTSENIKCGNLNKKRVIYHNEEKRVPI